MTLNNEIVIETRRVRKQNTNKFEVHKYILQGINEVTFNDIVKESQNKQSKKYPSVLIVFNELKDIEEHHLSEVITRHQNRWHVVGNPLQIKNTKDDMMVQGWYDRKELLALMIKEINKQFAYIIKLKKRDE